jgi:hypothetical protein
MPGTFQPLVDNQRVVNPDGTPTEYFIRWAQEKQIAIGEGITAEQALVIVRQFTADHPLVGGAGIILTPSGDLADDVTIGADVQAILDQISTTWGAVLFRGTADWQALAPGTSGQFLKTNGAGADPEWAAAGSGGGGGLFDISMGVPALSAFTSFNFTNASSAESAAKAVWISATSAASGGGIKGLAKAVPATPYRVAMLLQNTTLGADSWLACGWRRNDGALHIILQNGDQFAVQGYSNPTTFVSQQFTMGTNETGDTSWFGFYEDGTNVFFQRSVDGVNFVTLYSVAKASGFLGATGYNQAFFAIRQNDGCNSLITCRCWDEGGLVRIFP